MSPERLQLLAQRVCAFVRAAATPPTMGRLRDMLEQEGMDAQEDALLALCHALELQGRLQRVGAAALRYRVGPNITQPLDAQTLEVLLRPPAGTAPANPATGAPRVVYKRSVRKPTQG